MNGEDLRSKSLTLSDLAFNLGALVVYGLTISPMLRSAFLADDRFDTAWALVRSSKGVSAFSDGLFWTEIYRTQLGRFHPFAHITGALFFEISNRLTFKTTGFLLTLLSVALIGAGLNLWLTSRKIGGMFVLVMAAFSQFRPTYDPILSFGMHTKLLVGFMAGLFLSVGLIKRYGGSLRTAGYVSLNIFCLAMCLYHELAIAILISIFFLVTSLEHRDRRLIRANLSWWVISYFLLRFFLYRAIDINNLPPIYSVHLSPIALGHSYLVQLSGLVPFAQLTHFKILELTPKSSEIAGGIIAMFTVIYFQGKNRIERNRNSLASNSLSDLKSLTYFAFVLLFLPPCFTALSNGMQNWTQWWDGYLQVWIGEIGLAILVATTLNRYSIMLRKNHKYRFVLTVFIGCLVSFTCMANRNAVDNSPYWETNTAAMGWNRSIAENAIKSGLLNKKYVASDVLAMPPRPWFVNNYVDVLNQSSVHIQNEWNRFADSPKVLFRGCKIDSESEIFIFSTCGKRVENGLFVYASGYKEGFALLAQPVSLTLSKLISDQQLQIREKVEVRNGYLFIAHDKGCRVITARALDNFPTEVKLTRMGNQGLFRFRANDNFIAGSINTRNCLR